MVLGLWSWVLGLWFSLGWSQYHLAVAGGCATWFDNQIFRCAPTRYREVVLTPSKTKTKSQTPKFPIPHTS